MIPVVARLGVAGVKHKLVAELSGWDNNTWDLAELVPRGLIAPEPRVSGRFSPPETREPVAIPNRSSARRSAQAVD